jgi:hypothetical protein
VEYPKKHSTLCRQKEAWYANPAMANARVYAPAIMMPNAQVLIAGGTASSSVVLTNGERYSFGFRY